MADKERVQISHNGMTYTATPETCYDHENCKMFRVSPLRILHTAEDYFVVQKRVL